MSTQTGDMPKPIATLVAAETKMVTCVQERAQVAFFSRRHGSLVMANAVSIIAAAPKQLDF